MSLQNDQWKLYNSQNYPSIGSLGDNPNSMGITESHHPGKVQKSGSSGLVFQVVEQNVLSRSWTNGQYSANISRLEPVLHQNFILTIQ
jgi:hypothetical protein